MDDSTASADYSRGARSEGSTGDPVMLDNRSVLDVRELQPQLPADTSWPVNPRLLSDLECRPARAAMAWLRSLPVELQPVHLMRGHARIVNLLCHRWDEPELALRYLKDLLSDGRVGRHGFSAPVATELRALVEHLTWQLRGRRH